MVIQGCSEGNYNYYGDEINIVDWEKYNKET